MNSERGDVKLSRDDVMRYVYLASTGQTNMMILTIRTENRIGKKMIAIVVCGSSMAHEVGGTHWSVAKVNKLAPVAGTARQINRGCRLAVSELKPSRGSSSQVLQTPCMGNASPNNQ